MKNVLSAISLTFSGNLPESINAKKNRHRPGNREKIELGEPGSNVFVTSAQYSAAEATSSFTAMTTSLLISVFPTDVLIRSNYKGGAPKNAKDKSVKHTGLDEAKLKAIRETVKQRFRKQFNETDFGRCINVKCNKIRVAQNTVKNELPKKSNDKDSNNDKEKENNQ